MRLFLIAAESLKTKQYRPLNSCNMQTLITYKKMPFIDVSPRGSNPDQKAH
jgi:hypothetical protein